MSSGLSIPSWASFPGHLTWIILCRSGYTSHFGWVCNSFRGESKCLDVLLSSSPTDSKGFFPDSTSLVSSISTLQPDICTLITDSYSETMTASVIHFTVLCACHTTTHTTQRLQGYRDQYLDEEAVAALSSALSSSPSPMMKVVELFTGVG